MSKSMQRIGSLLLILVMVLTLACSTLQISADASTDSQISALEQQKKELQEKQSELKEQLNALQSQQADAYAQKASMDQEVEVIYQKIQVTQQQIQEYQVQIDQKQVELTAAEAERDAQKEKLETRMRAMEENGRYSYLETLIASRSLSELISKLDDIGEILQSDKELEDAYIAAVNEVKAIKEELETQQNTLKDTETELEAQQSELETQIANAAALIESLQGDIDEVSVDYNAYADKINDVNADISSLEAQKIAAAQAAKAAAASVSSGSSSSSSASVAKSSAAGQFIWPTTTRTITSYYGYRYHPITGTYKFHSGIDIGAGYGEPVYAAASGTCSVAYDASGFGNYVTINHGNGYSTLYGHLSSVAVSSGQSVSQGQVIGYVGSTGASTGPHLHYNVYYNGALTNPLSYY